jgi:hypothetical protein
MHHVALHRDAQDPTQTAGLAVIEEMLRATRKTKLIGGTLMAVMGLPLILVVLVPSIREEMGLGGALFIVGLGVLSVAMGGFFLVQAHRLGDVRRAPVFRTLVEAPERIVWFYEFVMTVNGVPNHSVVLMCGDGTKFEFNLRQADPSPLLHALSEMLPHAVFGYSRERVTLFKQAREQFAAAVRSAEGQLAG